MVCKDKYLFNPFKAKKTMSMDPMFKERATMHVMALYFYLFVVFMSIKIFSMEFDGSKASKGS